MNTQSIKSKLKELRDIGKEIEFTEVISGDDTERPEDNLSLELAFDIETLTGFFYIFKVYRRSDMEKWY